MGSEECRGTEASKRDLTRAGQRARQVVAATCACASALRFMPANPQPLYATTCGLLSRANPSFLYPLWRAQKNVFHGKGQAHDLSEISAGGSSVPSTHPHLSSEPQTRCSDCKHARNRIYHPTPSFCLSACLSVCLPPVFGICLLNRHVQTRTNAIPRTTLRRCITFRMLNK